MTRTILILPLISLAMAFPFSAFATTMSGDSFTIEGKPHVVSEKKPTLQASPAYKKSDGGQDIPLIENFTLGEISQPTISLSLPQNILDFDVLSPTNPVIRRHQLIITSQLSGYQVLAFENHPLQSKNQALIPDTTCDNGACSDTLASEWTNTLTYGFGYRCEIQQGKGRCATGFEPTNTYKQFADASDNQSPAVVAQNTKQDKQTIYTLEYKVNTSRTQQKDSYTNTITYLVIPNF
ncbi:MAG: hypothetical protein AAB553_07450 [Patescibacteria group bacterium]